MIEILYTLLFLVVLSLGMKIYSKWLNTKTPKADILSEKEVLTRHNEKFPIWYHLYPLIYIIVMFGFAIGLFVLSWFLIINYPQWMLSGKEYILLSTNPYGMYLSILIFFPGIIFGGFLLYPMYRIFTSLARYVEKNQLKHWDIRVRTSSNFIKKKYLKFAVIMSIFLVPIIALSIDNYYYVDKDSLHYNSFFGFGEKTIPLNNLQKIEVGAWTDGQRNSSINWRYVLVFNYGERFNLKEANMANLKELDIFLMTKNTPKEITGLTHGAIKWVDDNGSQDLKDLFTQIFSRPGMPDKTYDSQ
jgi:hypothetical protein